MRVLKVVLIFRNILLCKFPLNGQLLNVPVIYHCAKNQKKLMSYSWEKCWTHGEGEGEGGRQRQTERGRERTAVLVFCTQKTRTAVLTTKMSLIKSCVFSTGTMAMFCQISDLITLTHIHMYTEHTQGLIDWHIHKSIYQHQFLHVNRSLVMATCYVLLWINDSLISKTYLVQQVINDFVFQKLSTCKTHICWLY